MLDKQKKFELSENRYCYKEVEKETLVPVPLFSFVLWYGMVEENQDQFPLISGRSWTVQAK